jgi:hypothetical protein
MWSALGHSTGRVQTAHLNLTVDHPDESVLYKLPQHSGSLFYQDASPDGGSLPA